MGCLVHYLISFSALFIECILDAYSKEMSKRNRKHINEYSVLLELSEKYHGDYSSKATGYVSEPQRSRRQLCKDLEEDSSRLKMHKGRG